MRKLLKSTIGAMAVGLGMMMVVGCQNPTMNPGVDNPVNPQPEIPTYTVTLETPFETGKTSTGKVGDALPTEDEMNNTIPAELKYGLWYTHTSGDRALGKKTETDWKEDNNESGITFAGWYDGDTPVKAITPGLDGKTLTAKWNLMGVTQDGEFYCGNVIGTCSNPDSENVTLTLTLKNNTYIAVPPVSTITKYNLEEN